MIYLSFCWLCGVNFRTDDPVEDTCPECREKQSRSLANRLKAEVPLFQAIAERVQAIMKR